MPFKNPEDRRDYRRKWYARNRKSELIHVQRRKKEIKEWVWNYKKSLKCTICSQSHPAIIDFHHKAGKKDRSIAQMLTDGYSICRIKKELLNCEILCANCHRKIHFEERNKLLSKI
ncbi:MAG: hypothetical protein KKB21_02830 [Nanoarchaeota archaeon]|nr:hypothetical protein [Nanoarchaeota archaeon]MBU4086489.1 hypothetical protein [Nanoarchaeota archaeon]